MAKKRQEDPPKGSPAWMATFSDLMNLLLCFFVLLYSMSSVNEEKFQQVIASLQSTVSILPNGGASIGDGQMISAGVRQLEFLDNYYNEIANSQSETETDNTSSESVAEAYTEEALAESEKMAQQIQGQVNDSNLSEVVDIEFNAEYVLLNLSGAVLFESGKSELVSDAYPIVDKIGKILENYNKNIIEVEGHTDNVPIHSDKYESNDVLSMYRALSVANYFREHTKLKDGNIKSSGRGDYAPVANNSTAEGRALNRRVEIKIYNMHSLQTSK